MNLRSTLSMALLVAAAATHAQAQDRQVYPGDRVRVTDAAQWTGMVQGVSPDTLDVVPDGQTSARPVAISAVQRVEISLGERGKGRPFLIGGLAGTAVGAGTAALISELQSSCEDAQPDPRGFVPFCENVGPVAVFASGLIGFAAGGAVGALLGGGERWVRAAAPARVGSIHLRLRLAAVRAGRPLDLVY